MKQFGIVRWGETIMHAVYAEDMTEAGKKLEAKGHTGFIIEIINIDQAPSSPRSSVPPPKGPTHWAKACEILEGSRNRCETFKR